VKLATDSQIRNDLKICESVAKKHFYKFMRDALKVHSFKYF
jgi:hypothetical protein